VFREINNPVGQKFQQNGDDLQNLLNARNEPILAHGVVPIAKKTCEQFEKLILDLFVDRSLIEFPSLDW